MKCVSAKHAVEMDYSASCYLFEGHILCFEQYLIFFFKLKKYIVVTIARHNSIIQSCQLLSGREPF